MFVLSDSEIYHIDFVNKCKKHIHLDKDIYFVHNTVVGCIFASDNFIYMLFEKRPLCRKFIQLREGEKVTKIYFTLCQAKYNVIHTDKQIIIGKRSYTLCDKIVYVSPNILICSHDGFYKAKNNGKTCTLLPIGIFIYYVNEHINKDIDLYTIWAEKDILHLDIYLLSESKLIKKPRSITVEQINTIKQIYVSPNKKITFVTVDNMMFELINENITPAQKLDNWCMQDSALHYLVDGQRRCKDMLT